MERGWNDPYTGEAWRGRTAHRSLARPGAACGHTCPVYVDVVLGLGGDPPAAGAVGPLRQRRGVADHRRPAWLRVRRASLQPPEPIRRRLAEARDPGGSDRGRD